MKSKAHTTSPSGSSQDQSFRSGNGGGAIQLRRDSRGVPAEGSRIQVAVLSNLLDRHEGQSTTEVVWGEMPNKRFVTEALANPEIREEVANFFNRRGIVKVLTDMIPVTMIRPIETAYTKAEFALAVEASAGVSKHAVGPIVELALPALLKIGMVSANIKYSRQLSYGFKRVTVDDIRHDVAMFEVIKAVKSVSLSGIDPKIKVSKTVFAESVGEALRGIGLAIYEIIDLTRVMDDLIRGVRAQIDPTMAAVIGAVGSVPTDWKNHRVVLELAQNLVFVRAALSLPSKYSMGLTLDSYKLEKWAPVVLTAIKSSERYAWVGKAELLRHHTLRKVRDIKGKVVSAVLSRRVEVQPVAQAVFAVPDIGLRSSMNISATNDRIAEVVQAAYGSATFSTEIGAELIASALSDAIQMGWKGESNGYIVDTADDGMSVEDVAIMLADRVFVPIGTAGIELRGVGSPEQQAALQSETEPSARRNATWNPVWWYVVRTDEKSMDVWSGRHLGSEIVTADPLEVLMAAREFIAIDALPPRPQVLSAAAFNTRLIDFEEDDLRKVNARYTFKVDIMGLDVHGSFRAVDFASLRSGEYTSLVKPHFNAGVVEGLQRSFEVANKLLKSMSKDARDQWENGAPNEMFFAHMRHRAARELLRLAQKLSPAFRQEVHTTMVERALLSTDASGETAAVMRATLAQKTFAAFADVIALHFFLFLQDIDVNEWASIIQSTEMIELCMEMGSDR